MRDHVSLRSGAFRRRSRIAGRAPPYLRICDVGDSQANRAAERVAKALDSLCVASGLL